jgi:5-methylcytosine-specific restriction endonuclease McrA
VGDTDMMKACKYCGRVHDYNTVCPKKPQRKYYGGTRTDEVGAFRRSGLWRKKSLDIRERDFNSCRVCAMGKYGTYSGRQYHNTGLSVHHIVPLSEDFDLRLDDDNLITLCSWHHDMAENGTIPREELKLLAATPLFEEHPPG